MGCSECNRLRNFYEALYDHQRKLLIMYRDATEARDSKTILRLQDELAETDERRKLSRKNLLDHETTHKEHVATLSMTA